MAAEFEVDWFPELLTARLLGAFGVSTEVAAADALANRPSKSRIGVHANVGGETATIEGTGLAAVFEHGRRGGYDIQPKGQALKFPGGGFAASAKGGPMRAQPFLGPAILRWSHTYYQDAARRAL
jgi:hypothetical protein